MYSVKLPFHLRVLYRVDRLLAFKKADALAEEMEIVTVNEINLPNHPKVTLAAAYLPPMQKVSTYKGTLPTLTPSIVPAGENTVLLAFSRDITLEEIKAHMILICRFLRLTNGKPHMEIKPHMYLLMDEAVMSSEYAEIYREFLRNEMKRITTQSFHFEEMFKEAPFRGILGAGRRQIAKALNQAARQILSYRLEVISKGGLKENKAEMTS